MSPIPDGLPLRLTIMEGKAEMPINNRSEKFRLRRRQRGISMIESLVAAVIIATALLALVSTWLYAVRAALITDDRSAAYEVARTVLERARANGGAINQTMVSTPVPGNSRSNWISPSLLRNRFYSATLEEVGGGSNDSTPPAPPANAAFRVITTVTVSPDSTYPAGREDLRLVSVEVVVNKINPDGSVQDEPLTTLQTCLTQGGLL